jgi:hypothetical protein
MKASLRILVPLAAAVALSACGEAKQELDAARHDTPRYMGTGVAAFTAPGWKPGDKASWENELRARAQYGQNDYNPSRAN